MKELEGGTVNSLFRTNGTITKHFNTGNGIGTPPEQRRRAEYISMKKIGVAPEFRGFTTGGIAMSYVEGEKYLDSEIDSYPEAVRMHIYRQAGETLAHIHQQLRYPVVPGFHDAHMQRIFKLVHKADSYLRDLKIEPFALLEGLTETYKQDEIEKRGLSWIHGDYWLSNYIGRRVNEHFELSSVIDWETAHVASPYEDFAVVLMSVEHAHPESSTPFWSSYGISPDTSVQKHFAVLKTLEWMPSDEEGQETRFTTPFYQPKIEMIRSIL